MRYTAFIGSQADYIQHVSITPMYYPCPQCESQRKRKRVNTRRVAMLRRCIAAPGLSPTLASTRPVATVASISRPRFRVYHPEDAIPWKSVTPWPTR